MIYEQMLAESERLEQQIQEVQMQLKKFPDGSLFCTRNGKYYKWYLTDGKTHTYIPKKKHKLAEKLAAKKYLSFLVEDLIHEKKSVDLYLKRHHSYSSKAEILLANSPEYQKLISPYFTPVSQELHEWSIAPFDSNPKYPEQLIHKTFSGGFVRSKSEVIIDMVLRAHKIPFRYEAALQLGDIVIYPDFTIRHPKTGEFFYYEHFGLVDDNSYLQNMFSKLRQYISHGIIPTKQLITTYETKEAPLDAALVEKLVKDYFL